MILQGQENSSPVNSPAYFSIRILIYVYQNNSRWVLLCKVEGTGSCLLGNILPAMLIFLYCLFVMKKVWLDQRRSVEVGKCKKGIFTQFLASHSCLMRPSKTMAKSWTLCACIYTHTYGLCMPLCVCV